MIADQSIYLEGHRLPSTDLAADLSRLRYGDQPGFLWISMVDPSQEEFKIVSDALGLHELAVEDAMVGRERPKIEIYRRSLFVVLKSLHYIDRTSDIETGEVMMFVGEHFVVTVRKRSAPSLSGVRERVERHPEWVGLGPVSVLYAVMDVIVDNYLQVDAEVQRDLADIEQEVFQEGDVDVNAIYRLKREVLEFRRATQPAADSLWTFTQRGGMKRFPPEAAPFFRDISDHLRQVNDHIDSYGRLLSDILSARLATVSVQQNEDMRKISAWVAIAAVPTMIAGIYGMNFTYIPETHWSVNISGQEFYYGYFLVVFIMLLIVGVMYRSFKRTGWL